MQKLVWVDRVETSSRSTSTFFDLAGDERASSVVPPVLERLSLPLAGAATDLETRVFAYEPSLSLDEAVAARRALWPSALDALRALRPALATIDVLSRDARVTVDPRALELDASGRFVVGRLLGERRESPSAAATHAASMLVAVARALGEGASDHDEASSLVDRAQTAATSAGEDAVRAFDATLANAGLSLAEEPLVDAPRSLDEHPLATARLAALALQGAALDHALVDALSASLAAQLRAKSPVCLNALALGSMLERCRATLRAMSARDSGLDLRALALLGPLEPTWIPLHPEASVRTVLREGRALTLCPMQWDELQPTASCGGASESRFCVACARAVNAVEFDGELRVIASAACAFARAESLRPPP